MIAMIKGLAAGSVNVILALAREAVLPESLTIGTAMMLGFLGVGLSLVLFILALRHLGTARTGAYFSLAPFIGALTAIFVLHKAFTVQLAVAGLLMAVGSGCICQSASAPSPRTPALEPRARAPSQT